MGCRLSQPLSVAALTPSGVADSWLWQVGRLRASSAIKCTSLLTMKGNLIATVCNCLRFSGKECWVKARTQTRTGSQKDFLAVLSLKLSLMKPRPPVPVLCFMATPCLCIVPTHLFWGGGIILSGVIYGVYIHGAVLHGAGEMALLVKSWL